MKLKHAWVLLLLLGAGTLQAQEKGDWVLGKWKNGAFWFPGVVESRSGDSITITYDDGTRETVPLRQIKPYDWKPGSRIECRWANGREWYAGRITAMSRDGVTIHVTYDDGDREETRTGSCRSR